MEDKCKQLQKKTLQMLKEILPVFTKNDLRYYAVFGTCIGAVRHKGFIPWDDDIDIAMPRKDYEYLKNNYRRILPDHYEIISPENCKHYEVFFMKIHDVTTTFIPNNMTPFKDRHSGVFIDIFPLDGLPSNVQQRNKYIRKYKWYIKLNYKLRFTVNSVHGFRAKFLQMIANPLKLLLKYDFFYNKYQRMALSYDYDECESVTYATTTDENMGTKIFDKDIFADGCMLSFEDILIRCPKNYDAFLKQVYGNYMRFPDKSEQKPHHDYDVLDFNKSYKEYS